VRELFKPSKDLASLLVRTRKKFLLTKHVINQQRNTGIILSIALINAVDVCDLIS